MLTKTIALIFDFDDTLTNDSIDALLRAHNVDPGEFWKVEVDRLVKNGWEPALAYIHLLLKKIPTLTREELLNFGGSLKPFPGLRTLFGSLTKEARKASYSLDFYIISGGIQEIIEGFPLRSKFKAVWASKLASDRDGEPLRYVTRAITFTEKTRYLFLINKGIDPAEAERNPAKVNEAVPVRPVPFSHMIYVGDGLTDIPCFSLITNAPSRPGVAIAVSPPEKSARLTWLELMFPRRVTAGPYLTDYSAKGDLAWALSGAISAICSFDKLGSPITE